MVIDHIERAPMRFRITAEGRHIRADLFNRHTAEETATFLAEVAAECARRRRRRVLISVHASRPIFTVEKYRLSAFLDLALRCKARIAVFTDSSELRVADEYTVMLARLRGVDARTFTDEAAAIAWLDDGRR